MRIVWKQSLIYHYPTLLISTLTIDTLVHPVLEKMRVTVSLRALPKYTPPPSCQQPTHQVAALFFNLVTWACVSSIVAAVIVCSPIFLDRLTHVLYVVVIEEMSGQDILVHMEVLVGMCSKIVQCVIYTHFI